MCKRKTPGISIYSKIHSALQRLLILNIAKTPAEDNEIDFFKFLAKTVWKINYLIDVSGMQTDEHVIKSLVKLLTHKDPIVIIPALHALCKTMHGSNDQITTMLSFHALSHIRLLLTSPEKEIKIVCLEILTKVTASSKKHKQAVIEAELLPYVIQTLLKGDSKTKKSAAIVLRNTTFETNIDHIEKLIENNAIESLCSLLYCNNASDEIVHETMHVSITFVQKKKFN